MSVTIGLSGNLWPIHLKPFPNEILSSWMVRLAHAHGLKVQTFYSLVLGRNRNIWNRDIDKFAPDWLLETLSSFTGTPYKDVFNTTLRSYEGVLYEKHQPCGNTKWINPLGLYHRIHKDFGLQFCPICLAQDQDPYFRKFWRLAFYTECEKHHILLQDRCPQCGKAVNFHRVEMGIRSLIKPQSITNCYKCGYDLRNAAKQTIHCANWQTTIQYRTLLDFHQMGWGFSENLTLHYSHQLFDVLRHLCVIMFSKRRAHCLLPYITKKLGLNKVVFNCEEVITFEKLNVYDRHQLFHCAIWLTLDWPRRFVKVCNINNLSSAYLLQDYTNPPFWFYTVIDKNLNYSQYSPTFDEINSAREYLRRTGKSIGITSISRLLGYSTLKNN